jgi:hypothetical protein
MLLLIAIKVANGEKELTLLTSQLQVKHHFSLLTSATQLLLLKILFHLNGLCASVEIPLKLAAQPESLLVNASGLMAKT